MSHITLVYTLWHTPTLDLNMYFNVSKTLAIPKNFIQQQINFIQQKQMGMHTQRN